jgi:hypothetical protein
MYELSIGKDKLCREEAYPDDSSRNEQVQKANPIQQPRARNADDTTKI